VSVAYVTFVGFVQLEIGSDTIVGPEGKHLTEPPRIRGAADNAIRMQLRGKFPGLAVGSWDSYFTALLYHVPALISQCFRGSIGVRYLHGTKLKWWAA
jgi:hypothetical protein